MTKDWDKLSEDLKESMTTINDLYCGKHVVLNLQEYAGAALSDCRNLLRQVGQRLEEKSICLGIGKNVP